MENKIIKAGTKIVIKTFASVGAEDCTAYILESDYTESELEDIAWQEGVQYAESYGIYPPHDDIEDDDENEYSEDIEGYWELYDSTKHDDHLIYENNSTFTFSKL